MATGLKYKPGVTIAYTGAGKGKTSAGIGLACRALGHGDKVAFIQFIKAWEVSEHAFFAAIETFYGDHLLVHKGGKGFYNAGDLSAAGISEARHKESARDTFDRALDCVRSGNYGLVVCDEINNAVHDGLLQVSDLKMLIEARHETTSLCLTGRNFPLELASRIDILTEMKQLRHHYDDGYGAIPGIDY